MTLDLTNASFATLEHHAFLIRGPNGRPLQLDLVEVSSLGPQAHSAAPPREPFSLMFRGPPSEPLTQGTYTFAHAEAGRFDLFIVPVGQDNAGLLYEAIFN